MAKTLVEIKEERNYPIVKNNALIQKSRHQMNLQEQKIILYMISKLTPNDLEFPVQTFKIADFCNVIGADDDSGGNYACIKNTLKTLSDRSIWVTQEDESETILRWLSDVIINKRSGTVKIQFDKKMKPYLLDLKYNYTIFDLNYILAMKSQYSVRLYELLKSWLYKDTVTFGVDELKRLLFAENYKKFNDFQKRVFAPAVSEINKVSDIWATYELLKEGRAYTQIKFTMRKKTAAEELGEKNILTAHVAIAEVLDSRAVKCARCGTLNKGYVNGYFRCTDCDFGNYEPTEEDDDYDDEE